MRRKRFLSFTGGKTALVTAVFFMAAGLSITASAAGNDQKDENNSGKTTVQLGAAIVKADPAQNAGRNNKIIYPEGYHIRNLCREKDHEGNTKELVVGSVLVSSVKDAQWDLVDTLTGVEAPTDKKMAVSIGGMPLPAVTKGTEKFQKAKLTAQKSVFYDPDAEKTDRYKVLGDENGDGIHDTDGTMDLDVEFKIPPGYVPKTGGTVAQFKVMYVLTTRNKDGSIDGMYDQEWIDSEYVGPTVAAEGN